jgi:hypothetical protein
LQREVARIGKTKAKHRSFNEERFVQRIRQGAESKEVFTEDQHHYSDLQVFFNADFTGGSSGF